MTTPSFNFEYVEKITLDDKYFVLPILNYRLSLCLVQKARCHTIGNMPISSIPYDTYCIDPP